MNFRDSPMAARPAAKAPAAKAKAPAGKSKAAAAKTKAPTPKAAPKPAITVTLKSIVEQLAEGHELPKKQANAFLGAIIETIATHLKDGDRVRMSGLGILEVRKREARMGRNPATGASIQIAASKKVAFRPAKELKEAV
jgi:DNA-binding protein HU-beta